MAKPTVTIDELRRSARKALAEAGIDSAAIDSKILVKESLGLDESDLIANARLPVSSEKLKQFETMLARRLKHEPIAYIISKQPFWSLEFDVTPDVLIPRPETEGVVERAIDLLTDIERPVIVDIGTGSGAILLSLLHERGDAKGVGLDISKRALDVASQNADKIGVADRVKFVRSDYLANIDEHVSIVVSNPPYIADREMGVLDRTVADYEPSLALRGGRDGLDAYRSIVSDLPRVLLPRGIIVFEIGYDQAEAVTDLLKQSSFEDIQVDKDLAGHIRVVSGKLSV